MVLGLPLVRFWAQIFFLRPQLIHDELHPELRVQLSRAGFIYGDLDLKNFGAAEEDEFLRSTAPKEVKHINSSIYLLVRHPSWVEKDIAFETFLQLSFYIGEGGLGRGLAHFEEALTMRYNDNPAHANRQQNLAQSLPPKRKWSQIHSAWSNGHEISVVMNFGYTKKQAEMIESAMLKAYGYGNTCHNTNGEERTLTNVQTESNNFDKAKAVFERDNDEEREKKMVRIGIRSLYRAFKQFTSDDSYRHKINVVMGDDL